MFLTTDSTCRELVGVSGTRPCPQGAAPRCVWAAGRRVAGACMATGISGGFVTRRRVPCRSSLSLRCRPVLCPAGRPHGRPTVPSTLGFEEGREATHPPHLEKVECEIRNVNSSSVHFPVDPGTPGVLGRGDCPSALSSRPRGPGGRGGPAPHQGLLFPWGPACAPEGPQSRGGTWARCSGPSGGPRD